MERFLPMLRCCFLLGSVNMFDSFWTRLGGCMSPWTRRSQNGPFAARANLLVVLEGKHDIEFIKRISTTLQIHDRRLPDLARMELEGALVFVPFGGGDLLAWAHRLAGLGRAEFHLYDREMPPETEVRQRAANIVNLRPRCRAVLTAKRALENYLAPAAIFEAGGIDVQFSDDDDVAALVAQKTHSLAARQEPWQAISSRARKRIRGRCKRWLNTQAVSCMTVERLADRDPQGEIRGWLETIAQLAHEAR